MASGLKLVARGSWLVARGWWLVAGGGGFALRYCSVGDVVEVSLVGGGWSKGGLAMVLCLVSGSRVS